MDNLLVNYLRVTSTLEIERANSGHPGIALSSAPIVYSIYKCANVLPKQPNFINRDRIVFSAGHASALIYAALHLFSFAISVEDLKSFRSLGSHLSGHPEVDTTLGIDASTGPLGQGVGMAVGLAIAEEYLRHKFKKGNLSPIDHYTYCLVGDGCLMEGVALEAISLAGNLKLNKLIMLYDKNDITIEGSTDLSNRENVKNKFLSQNWNVLEVFDGNSTKEIIENINLAKHSDKPTLIIVNTKIGFGSDLEGNASVHGKPLNSTQIGFLRQKLQYFVPDFEIPSQAKDFLNEIIKEKEENYKNYLDNLAEYKKKFKDLYKTYQNYFEKPNFDLKTLKESENLDIFDGRNENFRVINYLYSNCENFLGGCADVAPSTRAYFKDGKYFTSSDREGRNIHFGIREHAMGAISNGISLHGGLKNFCSTFLCFANYMTPAIRLSALMKRPVLYIFTHDSIATGEDGPTHQSTEQIATLRAMPNLKVFRPCGFIELLASYENYFSENLPCAIILPRQVTKYVKGDFNGALMGGYKITSHKDYDLTLVATGSEVVLIMEVAKELIKHKIKANVVSMPCEEVFSKCNKKYKESVIDKTKPVFCVEASSDNIWYKYATDEECVFNLKSFGLSGKGEEVLKHFGFSAKNITEYILKVLKK